MPSFKSFSSHPGLARSGALPARFRRERVLIVGCGDVGQRVAQVLPARLRVWALIRQAQHADGLRTQGITPLRGDLDHPASLARFAGLATRVVHLAPPPAQGWHDPRTLALSRALHRRGAPRSLVYGSTSGVYGDCQGAWVAESRPLRAHTPRAKRRVQAEAVMRFYGRTTGARVNVLRIPGIYAADRVNGTPRARLIKGLPVLQAQDDVYTNHIHAHDLARACVAALWRGKPQRVYNINDDSDLKMGDYFDAAADIYGLPRPPRVPRHGVQDVLPASALSFMGESRRLNNRRMKQELALRLCYPTVDVGLRG